MFIHLKTNLKILILIISILILIFCVVCVVYDGTALFGEAVFDDPRYLFNP